MSDVNFYIVAHRGVWAGNIVQNTKEAAQLAQQAGADIVEIDVCRSKDGEYYLFHDGAEMDLLGVATPFDQLASAEIDALELLNATRQPSGYRVNRLVDFLAWLPATYRVNLDRTWPYWQDHTFWQILNNSGKKGQLLLKAPAEYRLPDTEVAYFPIIKSQADFQKVLNVPPIKLVGAEFVIADWQATDLLEPAFLQQMHQIYPLRLVNAENLGPTKPLFGPYHDDGALMNAGKDWQVMLNYGFNAIQTDWTRALWEFRQKGH